MNRDEILDLMKDGEFCTVTFIKANGEERTMNCRLGVKKHLKGGTKGFRDEDKGLITVWEPKSGYRSFKADKVISVKAKGKEYKGL